MRVETLPLLAHRADEAPGLVWAYAKRPGERPRKIGAGEIASAIAEGSGWVWLHVDLVDKRSASWAARLCRLPGAAHALLDRHEEDLLLGHESGVVHGVAPDFHQELDRATAVLGRLYFAATDTLLVTGRRHPLVAVSAVRAELDDGLAPDSASELLEAIIISFCREARRRLSAVSRELDDIEERLVADRLRPESRLVHGARRRMIALHRPIVGLLNLLREELPILAPLPQHVLDVVRRLDERLASLDRDILTASDRAKLLQEEVAAMLAEESNRTLKALAIISALLLPGTLVTGIFGMNAFDMPLEDMHGGFWVALGVVVTATLVFYLVLLRIGAKLRF